MLDHSYITGNEWHIHVTETDKQVTMTNAKLWSDDLNLTIRDPWSNRFLVICGYSPWKCAKCWVVSVTCIWPWVCSVCRNHNPVLSSLMTYHDLYILHVLWFSQRSFKSVGSSIYKYFFVCYSKHHDNYSIFRSVFKTAPFQCCSLSSLLTFVMYAQRQTI
jgi:hypothetical protein